MTLFKYAREIDQLHAIAVKSGIQAAIGIIARNGNVRVGRGEILKPPGRKDLPVALDGKRQGNLGALPGSRKLRYLMTIGSETQVRRTVCVESGYHVVIIDSIPYVPCSYQFPVGLQC